MVIIHSMGRPSGTQAWHDLNQFNHVVVPAEINAAAFEERRKRYCLELMSKEDKVEDAITGNSLFIKDQLIFMELAAVPGGCNPPQYAEVRTVPELIKEQMEESPRRAEGTHNAQPVLCRAGPGTGKTWMIKQALYLLAEGLGDDGTSGRGVRLVPIIMFVQRIVRLMREHSDDPTQLLSDPAGLVRWYISQQFAEQQEEQKMLHLAYEMCACCILVDGVDEAAGMRDVIEAFVHYELVPSGCRIIITSRPEGVDVEDYKARFVVMNLCELSQEQQRTVIRMQLHGNAFFDHLVNIAECRKELDRTYKELFPSGAVRTEIEDAHFGVTELSASDKNAVSNLAAIKEAAEASKAEHETDERNAALMAKETAEFDTALRYATLREAAVLNREQAASSRPPRRLVFENQAELQSLMAKVADDAASTPRRSPFLADFHARMMQRSRPAAGSIPLLELLETEIRQLPSPSARVHLHPVIDTLAQAQPGGILDEDVRLALMLLALQRKQPVTGLRRGSKAVPVVASGLWYQVTQHVEESYLCFFGHSLPSEGIEYSGFVQPLMFLLGAAAAHAGVEELALKKDSQLRDAVFVEGSAPTVPTIEYRNPVSLWLEGTFLSGAAEPAEPLVAWCASVTLRCKTGEQCNQLLRQLVDSIELELHGEHLLLTPLELCNRFKKANAHPSHLRFASIHVLISSEKRGSMPVMINIEHQELVARYEMMKYAVHYDFFRERVVGMTQSAFDSKLETLLTFLAEAIGVPVLLSLLLLTSSSSSTSDSLVIDLDDLPGSRHQLYKLGILSGIRKRMAIEMRANQTGKGKVDAGKAAENGNDEQGKLQRVKRKSTLEQNLGNESTATGDKDEEEKKKGGHAGPGNGPIFDLNSILRGKKVRVVVGEDDVSECYSLAVRVLDKSRQAGFDLRSGIVAVVPKSHAMHAVVTAFVEYVLMPPSRTEVALQEICKKMLRRVAVENQQQGRREFTSKDVACCLGLYPEELSLWSRLDHDLDHGVALAATLAVQTERAPAQYQFKHLSFQEGLYAEHLLMLVTSLAPPQGPGWQGWVSDNVAAEFLNNRYMNNTCRIAAGYLGGLLARQRGAWDFREAPLSNNGRSALWFITDENLEIEAINVARNDIQWDDVPGICHMLGTCPKLGLLDLSRNDLHLLVEAAPVEARRGNSWHQMCTAIGANRTLTDLNLGSNRLGGTGVRMVCNAIRNTKTLQRLGLSYNEPGVEPALAEMLRVHPSLASVEVVEALDRHLPSRAKDDIGRALMENKAAKLGFLSCNTFVLSEKTRTLTWPKEASTSDAVLLAGALRTNTVLTTFNLAPGAELENKARSAIGQALLSNPHAPIAFCNDFGLTPTVDTAVFDLSTSELKEVEPFRLLAGCLRGNTTLVHLRMENLRIEQISTLALALRGNKTLKQLELVSTSRTFGGQSVVQLPVPELNGSNEGCLTRRIDMSTSCVEGTIGRVTCAMIGTLIATNTVLECLDLSETGVGQAIGYEGEGGHILFKPVCESSVCPISEIVLNKVELNDKAGGKLISALASGLGEGDHGYDKITSLSLAHNDLSKQFTTALKQLMWSERAPCVLQSLDVSYNLSLDGLDLGLAFKRNESLTSLDISGVPGANNDDVYSYFAAHLLQPNCMCRLGFLMCDAFQVAPGQTSTNDPDLY